VFLIFKESVNNAVRHSHCTRSEVEFIIEDGQLRLTVRDNGRGFNLAEANDGNGLFSMRQRAAEIGGTLEVRSNNGSGSGTILKLMAPLAARRGWVGNGSNGHSKSKPHL